MSFLPPLPPPLHPVFDLLHVMTILQLPRQCPDVAVLLAGKHRDAPDHGVLPSWLVHIRGWQSHVLAKPQPVGGCRRAPWSHQRGAPVQMSPVKEMTCSRMWLASKCDASPLIVCCVILSGFFALPLPGKASAKSAAFKTQPQLHAHGLFFLWLFPET